MELPFEKNNYDYIIFGNVLEYLKEPKKTMEKLRDFLKKDGGFIISISKVLKRNGQIQKVTREQVERELKKSKMDSGGGI